MTSALSAEDKISKNLLETEFIDGKWVLPTEFTPDALVTYGPDVGWLGWAKGKLGKADNYEDAKEMAEYYFENGPY